MIAGFYEASSISDETSCSPGTTSELNVTFTVMGSILIIKAHKLSRIQYTKYFLKELGRCFHIQKVFQNVP